MRDMNFFIPLKASQSGLEKGFILKTIIVIILLSMITIPIGLFAYTLKMNASMEVIKEVLSRPDNVSSLETLKTKNQMIYDLNIALENLKDKNQLIKSKEWFTEELLQIVIDTLPKQIRISSFSLSDNPSLKDAAITSHGFAIMGVAQDKPAIAELEYNLRQTNRFKDIIVSEIKKVEGLVSFDIKFNVKDGAEP